MKKRLLAGLATGLLVFGVAGVVNATTILSADAVINNTLGEWSSTFSVGNMIDQSGLSIGFDSGVTDFDSYFSQNPNHIANTMGTLWGSSNGATSGIVDFDLGSVFSVSDFALWSDANQGTRSLSENRHFGQNRRIFRK